MKLHELMGHLERIAPLRLAESWDNVGLMVGDPQSDVTTVLLTIDCTEAVFREARGLHAQLVVAYHPLVFQGLKSLPASSLVFRCARDGVAVYSPHTALDVADGGTNDVLADAVGMLSRTPVRVTQRETGQGLGRQGPIAPTPRGEMFERIKKALGVESLLVAGPREGDVARVAVGAGACGDMIHDVLRAKVDLYLTGEMRHHDALRAASEGVTVVAALHSNSERVTLERVRKTLEGACEGVTFVCSREDRDPFEVV